MNLVAVFENDCRMPVKFTYFNYDSDRHFSYTENSEVNYPFLSDKYYFEYYDYLVSFSIGDVFVLIGMPMFAIFGLRLTWRLKKISQLNAMGEKPIIHQ